MAGEPQPGGGRRDLTLAVRLHHAARYQRVGARIDRFLQDVVELAQLVAAEADAGAILALDPKARSTEMRRQALHRLQRRRKMGKAKARKAR
jgi:hypothetical protein